TGRAAMNDVLAHGLQYRQGNVEVGLLTTDHEGQGAGGGTAGAAGDRRVDHAVAFFRSRCGDFAGTHGVDCGTVNQAYLRGDVGQQAVFTQVDRLYVGGGGQHGDDHFNIAAGQLGDARRGAGASGDQAGYGCFGQVEYGQLMA